MKSNASFARHNVILAKFAHLYEIFSIVQIVPKSPTFASTRWVKSLHQRSLQDAQTTHTSSLTMLDVSVLSILSLGSFFVDFNYNLLSCVLLYIFRCFSLTIQRHWRSISLYICTKRVEILYHSSVSILGEFQVYICKNHVCRDIFTSEYGKIASCIESCVCI